MISPLSDHYFCERLPHSGKLSASLVMPDQCAETYFDAAVLVCGPGRLSPNGHKISLQAEVGDRVLCDPAAFQHYEPGNPNTRKGFVSDRHLLGVIRAETGHAALEPAADILLIDPDPRQDEEVLASGVVVVKGSLPGEEQRERQRGFELLQGYADLLQSSRYQEQRTSYDKFKLEKDYIEPMSVSDRRAFEAARSDQARQQAKMGAFGSKLVLDAAQYTAQAPMRMRDLILSGILRGIGPDAKVEAEIEQRVRWDKNHVQTRVAVGGVLRLLVPAKYVLAVMEG